MAGKREQTPDIMSALISGGAGRREGPTTEETPPEGPVHEEREVPEELRPASVTPSDVTPAEHIPEREPSTDLTPAPADEEYGNYPAEAPETNTSRPTRGSDVSRSPGRRKKHKPTIEWEENPLRKNATYHLSTQVQDELESLYLDLRAKKRAKRSKSEIVEAALRLALEDAQSNGDNSFLIERLKAT